MSVNFYRRPCNFIPLSFLLLLSIMSSRQMKRALADDLSALATDVDASADCQRSRPAAFAFSNSDTSSEESSSEEEEEQAAAEQAKEQAKARPTAKPPATTTKTTATTKIYDEDSFLNQAAERARKEAVLRAVAEEGDNEHKEQMKLHAVFAVNPKDFSVETELKRKFGTSAVANAEAQSVPNGGRRHQGRFQARGTTNHHNGQFGNRHAKKTFLVKTDPNWPKPPNLNAGGLGMIVSEATNQKYQEGCTYYRFVQGSDMTMVQMEYQQRIQTHDPNQIQMHVRNHPFHPPGLWRMSKIYSATGQHDASAMLLRRCIYVYECGFHSSFLKAAQQGTARMDFEDEPSEAGEPGGGGEGSEGGGSLEANRNFFQSLYDHAVMASRRGCRRSALELIKLLYQLDSRDPMGVVLAYDRYLSSRKYLFFFI